LTKSKSEAKVAVVVPVYNGSRTICATVKCLLRQSHRPHEIIVVDDGSTDGTAEVLKVFEEGVRVISKPNGGPASARNSGVRAATGDFVAFTDGDCLPDGEWLAHLLRGFDAPEVAGVGGVIRRADEGLVSEYVDVIGLFNPGLGEDGSIIYLATGNACFRRGALLEAGLFDETFRKPGGEEPELCTKIRKMGYVLKAVEDAVVLHHHKQTVKNFLKTIANYGEGQFLFVTIWPEHRLQGDARKEMLRHLVALRTMFRRSLVYRPQHGLRKALFFSLLDQLKYPAFLWGYLRGQKKSSSARAS
jgi:glycosyltransferase involved in cell wall biosynthesis